MQKSLDSPGGSEPDQLPTTQLLVEFDGLAPAPTSGILGAEIFNGVKVFPIRDSPHEAWLDILGELSVVFFLF